MRKSIKAIICAASAAVMCAAPTAATFAGVTANTAITAEAASFVSYSNNEVKFDESQINTTVNSFTRTYLSYGDKKSFTRKDVQLFEKQCVTFEVRTSLPSEDSFKRAIQSMKLHVNFYMDEKKQYSTSHDYTVKYSRVINTSTHEKIYLCICEFLSYGTSYEASLENLNSSYNGYALDYSKTNIKVTGNSFDYYKVQATPSSGEKFYAVFPKKVNNTSVNTTYLKNWAKNQCLLANSLKELTGSSMDTIFVVPISYIPVDYIPIDSKTKKPVDNALNTSNTSNFVWGGSPSKYAVIRLDDGGVKAEAALMNSSNARVMNKYLTHEMGHAYAGFKGDDWSDAYNYAATGKAYADALGTADENYTNVRSLTAMNNCTNLKNYKIKDAGRNLSVPSVYDQVFDNGDITFTFCFAQSMIKKTGFDNLEKFYRADNASSYSSWSTRKFGRDLLKRINLNVDPQTVCNNVDVYRNYFMFVNGLRGLGITDLDQINTYFADAAKQKKYKNGEEFIKEMIVYLFGRDLKGA